MTVNDDKTTNGQSLSDKVTEPGFLREVVGQVRLVWYLLKDPNVPVYLKLIPFLPLIYVIWPADLLPDIFPVLGQVDDITAIVLGSRLFVSLSPKELVAYYKAEIDAERVAKLPAGDDVSDRIVIDPTGDGDRAGSPDA